MLDIIHVNFDYPEKPLLQDVCFSVPAGRLLHLRGANGAGKTTMLKLIAGLLPPSSGEIVYGGVSVATNLAAYQRNICYVGHKPGISMLLSVRENCRFDLQRSRSSLSVEELLMRFSLSDVADMPCGLLSAGQRKRVALMRLLMSEAALWLLDEPLVALDADAINLLMTCIAAHLSQNGQVILTSHQSLPLAAGSYQEYCL